MRAPEARWQVVPGFGVQAPRRTSSLVHFILAVIGAGIFAISVLTIAQLVEEIPRPSLLAGHDIPQVVGMSLPSVEAIAREKGITVQVLGQRPSEQYPRGVIVQQSPVAGWHMQEASLLRVTLSDGLVVPNIVGRTLEDAQGELSRLGWTMVQTGPADNISTTRLIRLQYPAPGLPVDGPGEISVALDE
jgi:beta-lactam-binding protein with PASTA domain